MFSTCKNEAVEFISTWKTESTSTSTAVGTDPIAVKETECQVVEMAEKEAQTDDDTPIKNEEAHFNETSLLLFLRQITPKVEEELNRQNRSVAFDSYSQLEEESETGLKQLHILKWMQLFSDGVVSSMDWSCTGSVIGVAYSASSHSDWCDHTAAIAIWNINRSDFSAIEPEQVIETSSCVSSIAFHPKNPAVFAVGTLSGEILVYDLSLEDQVSPIVAEEIDGASITIVKWTLTAASHTQYYLVSTTTTGAILIWTFDYLRQTLSLNSGFLIMEEDIPRSVRSEESSGVAIRTITFSKDNPSIFVVGAEGGSIMLCSTNSNIPSGVKQGNINLNKCVTSHLSPHSGKVLVTDSTSHHRYALMSLASDNQLRLYSFLQTKKPVSVIHIETSLTTACWSPSKPAIVIAGTVSGQVRFYSFDDKIKDVILSLPAHEKSASISSTVFNKKNISLLAVGDVLGRVTIWQLPNHIISQVSSDQSTLDNLVNVLDT